MNLEQRLARVAELNSRGLGGNDRTPSNEATVEGRDKETGQYMVRRNGHFEMAESATTGIIKPGVNTPVVQGKVFAVPHQPRPKAMPSFPNIANAEKSNVFIACLPYVKGGLSGDPTPYFVGYNGFLPARNANKLAADGAFFADEYDRVVPAVLYANEAFEDVHWRMDRSLSYEILKAVYDFVFATEEERSPSTSALPLLDIQSARVYYGGHPAYEDWIRGTASQWRTSERGKYVRTEGFAFQSPANPLNGFSLTGTQFSDSCNLGVSVLDLSRRSTNGYTLKPAYIQKFLRTAVNRPEKTLIIVPPNQSLDVFWDYTISNSFGNNLGEGSPYGADWLPEITIAARLAASVSERLIGVATHGVSQSIPGPNGGKRINSGLNGSAGNSYVNGFTPLSEYDASRQFVGYRTPIVHTETYPPKNQKQFAGLMSRLSERVGTSLYLDKGRYFTGVSKRDRLQTLYGDSSTPHFWIKPLSKASVDEINMQAEADALGIRKAIQYNVGLDIRP
jgi:hypothetical protein